MSEMMQAYQEINKRRQSDEMDVNSLTMFAEAWDYQQAKIDNLQKQAITQGQNFNDLAQKLKDVEYFNQKLQGRIDEALKVFKSDLSPIGKFNTIHNILKGKENDRTKIRLEFSAKGCICLRESWQ